MHLARIQLFTLFRDTKWIAAVSIALATLLYFPAQISELYRAILAARADDSHDLMTSLG